VSESNQVSGGSYARNSSGKSGYLSEVYGVPVRKSDRQFGYVHSCVSYPIGDLEIVV